MLNNKFKHVRNNNQLAMWFGMSKSTDIFMTIMGGGGGRLSKSFFFKQIFTASSHDSKAVPHKATAYYTLTGKLSQDDGRQNDVENMVLCRLNSYKTSQDV